MAGRRQTNRLMTSAVTVKKKKKNFKKMCVTGSTCPRAGHRLSNPEVQRSETVVDVVDRPVRRGTSFPPPPLLLLLLLPLGQRFKFDDGAGRRLLDR